jgi:hypothetical protein
MKPIKILGLAALAGLAVSAIIGVSSAMAEETALCGADEAVCASPITHLHEVGGVLRFLTPIGIMLCTRLFLGDTLSSRGSTITVHGSNTYTNCHFENESSSCTFTEESGPGEMKLTKEGHETASVTFEFLLHVVCSGFIDCSYNGVGLKGTAKGPLLSAQTPDNGEVSLSEQATNKEAGGFLCPKTAKLDIVTTPLSATYISS